MNQARNRGADAHLSAHSVTFRPRLFAGVSLIALAALGAPGAAQACSGTPQIIMKIFAPNQVISNGGSITVEAQGLISNTAGSDAVLADQCSITTLTDQGTILGGAGETNEVQAGSGVGLSPGLTIGVLSNSQGATISGGEQGGAEFAGYGVVSGGAITTLTNAGTINGGSGYDAVSGGGGVRNAGTLTSLSNTGTITGGQNYDAGAGVSNTNTTGTLVSLTNSGTITGGAAFYLANPSGSEAGAGVANKFSANLESLNNQAGGTIQGGAGAAGVAGGAGVANGFTFVQPASALGTLANSGSILGGAGATHGAGGAGVANSGTLTALTNNGSGKIVGGTGGSGAAGGAGVSNSGKFNRLTNNGTIRGGGGGSSAAGGAGVLNNKGTITALTNNGGGTIAGGAGGRGDPSGAAGGAGVSNTAGGTIAALTNSGKINGGSGGSGTAHGVSGAGVSNAGLITALTNSGTIGGHVGVLNTDQITTLHNVSGGVIQGGDAPGLIFPGFPVGPNTAGVGVANAGTIAALTNAGTIAGGSGNNALNGGTGLLNRGTLAATNTGSINGGQGFYGGDGVLNWGNNASATLSNINVISGGAGLGRDGGMGVANVFGGTFGTLNNGGKATIQGGAGGPSGVGGIGVYNDTDSTITLLSNSGAILGGQGGTRRAGGAGVQNENTITALTNNAGGRIAGGTGGSGAQGGVGVWNFGSVATLTNKGTIGGGKGGTSAAGGAAIANNLGTITTLTNGAGGMILGGAAGRGGGATGAGVSNASVIGTLANYGTISGGIGVLNSGTITTLHNYAGGIIRGAQTGIKNTGTGSITTLINAGLIDPTAVGGAILSQHFIGSIVNTGEIVGSVEIDNQANLNVYGGTDGRFGSWTGGTITIGEGNLIFARGDTALGDNIDVDGGLGTVSDSNEDPLMILSPVTITGNYQQLPGADLDLLLSSTSEPAPLTVTGNASLAGGLEIAFARGFQPMSGDTFDLLAADGDLTGAFGRFSYFGHACMEQDAVWNCGDNVIFALNVTGGDLNNITGGMDGALELTVVNIPEPSTWAMLGVGFLGLGALALRRRQRALAV